MPVPASLMRAVTPTPPAVGFVVDQLDQLADGRDAGVGAVEVDGQLLRPASR